MLLKKIQIKNFLSIKDIEVNFDNYDGVIQIAGENRDSSRSNGSGKSSVVESVVYALFGRTLRGINKETIVNDIYGEALLVRLYVNDIYIERGLKPSTLKVFRGDVELTQANQTETQKWIDDYLKINYKIFVYSVIYGQHNLFKFLSASPDDKRNILKNYLNVQEYFVLREKAKGIRLELKSKLRSNDLIIEDVKKSLKDVQDKIQAVEKESNDLNLPDISLEEILELENKKKQVEILISTLYGKTGRNTQLLADDYICNSCGQKVKSKDVDREKIKKENDEIDLEIAKAKIQLRDIKIPISSKEYGKIIKLKELQAQKANLIIFRDDYDKKIQKINQEQEDFIKVYDVMKFWEVAFSEEGLFKYLIINILEYFNTKCNYYLAFLSNGSLYLEFDTSLNETIISNKRTKIYESLSGGEQKMIDLSIVLALNNLLALNGNLDCNIIFLDEFVDSLDYIGVIGLYNLLVELKKTKKIFIITHNKDLQNLLENDSKISIIKEQGISRIEYGQA